MAELVVLVAEEGDLGLVDGGGEEEPAEGGGGGDHEDEGGDAAPDDAAGDLELAELGARVRNQNDGVTLPVH